MTELIATDAPWCDCCSRFRSPPEASKHKFAAASLASTNVQNCAIRIVAVERPPEYYVAGGPDVILDQALKLLRKQRKEQPSN